MWFASPLGVRVNEYNSNRFEDWLRQTLDHLKDDEFAQALVAYLCWFVWKARCNKVFSNVEPKDNWVINSAVDSVNEYWKIKILPKSEKKELKASQQDMRWKPPDAGELKVNIDGASLIGINGHFLWALCITSEELIISKLSYGVSCGV